MAGSINLTSFINLRRNTSKDINAKELLITWIGDSSNGSVPGLLIDSYPGWYISKVITNPGIPAPSANYNVQFIDSDGVDIMEGSMNDRSATISEKVLSAEIIDSNGFTITITDQSELSASGTIKILLTK